MTTHRRVKSAAWTLVGAAMLGAACSSKSAPSPPDCCAPGGDAGVDAPTFHPGGDGGASSPRDAQADRTVPHDGGARHVDAGGAEVGARDAATGTDGHPATDAPTCTQCGRDWATHPAIAQADGATELWVVSDIHADYQAALTLFRAAHLLASTPSAPSAAAWSGGSATLVVVGDMIDKGPDAPDVVTLVMALQASAPASGGQVIVTMGNHEAEFLANPQNSSAAGSDGIDPQLASGGLGLDATASGGDPLGAFLRALPVAARVDDWFFVHAGNTGGATLAALSSQVESGVDSAGFGAAVLSGASSMLEARLSSSPPQWWDATGDATSLLTAWTAALGAKHLVMGHQPGSVGITGGADRPKATMAAEYGGLLFLIDTGMSVDVDDTGGALLHVTGVNSASEAWDEVLPTGATKSL